VTKSQQKSFRSIQTILSDSPIKNHHVRLLEQNQIQSRLLAIVQELLPETTKPHCLNAQLKHDVLIIHTDSSAWAAKLRFQLAALLPALRRQAGYHAATNVVVRVQLPLSPHFKKQSTASKMDQHTAQQIRELASSIRDETLRQTWLKLADNALSTPNTECPDN